jgi:hypothetical protein
VTAAALGLALALAASGELELSAGVSSTWLGRTTASPGTPATTTAEGLVAPSLSAALSGPDAAAGARYRPVLAAPRLATSPGVTVLHAGDARLDLRPAPAWLVTASGATARGTTDLLTEARRDAGELRTISSLRAISYRADRADLRLAAGLDPRLGVAASAGWFADGGDGAASRAYVPLEQGVRVDAALRWSATPIDAVDGRTEATRVDVLGRTDTLVQGDLGWRRRVLPTLDAWGRGGAVAVTERGPGGGPRRSWLPALEAGVADAGAPTRLVRSLRVRTGAVVDRSTGDVARELEVLAQVAWRVSAPLTLATRAGATALRLPEGNVRRLSAEARLDWALGRQVTLGAGVFGDWQLADRGALPSVRDGGVLVLLSAATLPHGPETRAGAPP